MRTTHLDPDRYVFADALLRLSQIDHERQPEVLELLDRLVDDPKLAARLLAASKPAAKAKPAGRREAYACSDPPEEAQARWLSTSSQAFCFSCAPCPNHAASRRWSSLRARRWWSTYSVTLLSRPHAVPRLDASIAPLPPPA